MTQDDNDIQKVIDELADEGIYIAQDFESHCKICDVFTSLREAVCFDCAEAQSILIDGIDMYDKGLDSDGESGFKGNKGRPAETAFEKLELLIQKDWRNPAQVEKLEKEIKRLTLYIEFVNVKLARCRELNLSLRESSK